MCRSAVPIGITTAVGGSAIGGAYGGILFLAWPALFLSLGWNFLEFAFKSRGGPELGWLIPGILFMLMGGGPLAAMLPSRGGSRRDPAAMRRLLGDFQARRRQVGSDEDRPDPFAPRSPVAAEEADAAAGAVGGRTDLTSRLERLATLHASGSLTDAEFEEAKRRVMGEVASGR